MKPGAMEIYQQRMDKCTAEQFWMVALIVGMNGFLMTQGEMLTAALGTAALCISAGLTVLVGIAYVLSRHAIYVHYERIVARCLSEGADADADKIPGYRLAVARLSGMVIYTLMMLASGTGTMLVLLK